MNWRKMLVVLLVAAIVLGCADDPDKKSADERFASKSATAQAASVEEADMRLLAATAERNFSTTGGRCGIAEVMPSVDRGEVREHRVIAYCESSSAEGIMPLWAQVTDDAGCRKVVEAEYGSDVKPVPRRLKEVDAAYAAGDSKMIVSEAKRSLEQRLQSDDAAGRPDCVEVTAVGAVN